MLFVWLRIQVACLKNSPKPLGLEEVRGLIFAETRCSWRVVIKESWSDDFFLKIVLYFSAQGDCCHGIGGDKWEYFRRVHWPSLEEVAQRLPFEGT